MINWGLADNGNSFQNALAQGFQMGDMMRQRREEKEYRNALAQVFGPKTQETPQPSPQAPAMGGNGIVATPEQQAESERLARHFGMEGVTVDDRQPSLDPQALAVIAQRNPALAQRLQEGVEQRQRAAQTQDLVQRAIGGDETAMTQLATVNFDMWKSLSTEQRTAAEREAKIFGNAALDVLNRPPEQRQAAVMAYAQQLGQQYPEVAQIAQLPPDQLEMALRAAVAEAQMVGKLIELEQPNYRVIPEGGSLVDVGNPQAVRQFAPGAPQQSLPQVTTPDEAMRLPPGSQFMLPDGRIGTVPGGPASAPGGFPGN